MIDERIPGYPYPGAWVSIVRPIDADAFQPRSWGVTGLLDGPLQTFEDPNAHFVDDGLGPFEPFFAVAGVPPFSFASSVFQVIDQTHLSLTTWPGTAHTAVVYKAGQGSLHTFTTLAKIISARAVDRYCINYRTIWTSAIIARFNRGLTGDVYTI